MILRRIKLISILITVFFFTGKLNGELFSGTKIEDKTSKYIELMPNARINVHNISSNSSHTGSFEFLSYLSDYETLNSTITLLSVYNNATGLLLGSCQTKHNVKNIENNWRQFKWKIENNFLFCGVYNEPSILRELVPLSNNAVYTIRFGNGYSHLCLKNLIISDFDTLINCTLNSSFEVYKTKCGCSLLTLPNYSALYDLPLLNDDGLRINDDNIAFSSNNPSNPEVANEINNFIKFPIFQPSTDSSQKQKLNSNLSDLSDNENQPLFNHLKVSLLNKTFNNASELETEPVSIMKPLNFTPPPEIWIRATRPLLRRKISLTPTVSVIPNDEEDVLHISTASSFIASNVNRSMSHKNSSNSSKNLITPIIENTDVLLLKCTPQCENGGICVKTNNSKNVCMCKDNYLGLNCNILNPCANATKCTHYSSESQCITDKEAMSIKAPTEFVEAPHFCLCQDDNSEWNECDEIFKMEFNPSNLNSKNITTLVLNNKLPINELSSNLTDSFPLFTNKTNDVLPIIELSKNSSTTDIRIPSPNSSIKTSEASEDLSDNLENFELTTEPAKNLNPTFPMKNLSNLNISKINKTDSNVDQSATINESESTESFFKTTSNILDLSHFPIVNVSLQSNNQTILNNNNIRNEVVSVAPFTKLPNFSHNLTNEKSFEIISTTFLPSINQELTSQQFTNIHSSTSSTSSTFTVPKLLTIESDKNLSKISNAITIPTITNNELFENNSSNLENESDGDNGFERITQHIEQTIPNFLISKGVDSQNFSLPFNKNDETISNINNNENNKINDLSKKPYETLAPNDLSTTETTIYSTIKTRTNDNFDKEIDLTFLNKNKINSINEKKEKIKTNKLEENDFFNHETSVITDSSASSSSSFANDTVSWIIAIGILSFFLLSVVTGLICVGRYVRKSRRLHGKYNPAREETAVASTYAMPMTAVSKEERLI